MPRIEYVHVISLWGNDYTYRVCTCDISMEKMIPRIKYVHVMSLWRNDSTYRVCTCDVSMAQ